eukprot:3034798-Rhodomonas_salina.1
METSQGASKQDHSPPDPGWAARILPRGQSYSESHTPGYVRVKGQAGSQVVPEHGRRQVAIEYPCTVVQEEGNMQ